MKHTQVYTPILVSVNPIRTGLSRITLCTGGISARCGSILKKSDSMVSYGDKEVTCQILSKSGEKHGSYGSSKKIGTRDSSRIRDKEQKTQNGPNRNFFFFKINEKFWK